MPTSFNGEWYIPSLPKQKLNGILEFDSSKDKYLLKLYSSNNLHGTAIDIMKPDSITGYSIILGDCNFGEKVTLVSADIRSRKPVHNQLHILTIEPDWILAGGHFHSVGNVKIKQLSCEYKFLTSWIDGDQTYFDDLAKVSETSALQQKIPIKLPGEINVTFLRALQKEGFGMDRKISLEVKHYAVFTSDHYLPFEQFHARAIELKKLMEFSVGKQVQSDYREAAAEFNQATGVSSRNKDHDPLPLRIDFGNQRNVLKTDKWIHQNGMLFSRQGIGPVSFFRCCISGLIH